jgi:hypothetical protein
MGNNLIYRPAVVHYVPSRLLKLVVNGEHSSACWYAIFRIRSGLWGWRRVVVVGTAIEDGEFRFGNKFCVFNSALELSTSSHMVIFTILLPKKPWTYRLNHVTIARWLWAISLIFKALQLNSRYWKSLSTQVYEIWWGDHLFLPKQ